MVKNRQDELRAAENEHKVDSVQERFPNDDLHLSQSDDRTLVSKQQTRFFIKI